MVKEVINRVCPVGNENVCEGIDNGAQYLLQLLLGNIYRKFSMSFLPHDMKTCTPLIKVIYLDIVSHLLNYS